MITNVPTTQELTESSRSVTVGILLLLTMLLITFAFGLPYIAKQNISGSHDGNVTAALP